jgi:DNA-binding transcriptional LysR family regulator
MTQPGVTRQIQRLEQELRVTLFDRRRAGLELTRGGERLLRYAEETLGGHERLLSDLRKATGELTGELKIAASTTPGEFLVPELLNRFTSLYPNVSPRVFISDSAQVVEEVRERRWDVGFVGAKKPGRGLRYDVIYDDEIVLAVPPTHPFAKRSEIDVREIEGHAFVSREPGSGTRQSVNSLLARQKVTLPEHKIVMVLNSAHGVLSAVERGYGVGWISTLSLKEYDPGRIGVVRLKGLPLRRPLYLVQERDYQLPPVASVFVEWVRINYGAQSD